MDLNFDVDMHVMLAPVSYNHFSVIAGEELISIRGLLSSCLVTSLIFLIFWSANFTQVCLIRVIIAGFPKGSGSAGSGVDVHCSWCSSFGGSGGSGCLMIGLSLCSGVEPKTSFLTDDPFHSSLDLFC